MATVGGALRIKLDELSVSLTQWNMSDAENIFRDIVENQPYESLVLVSPELRTLVQGFHKKRHRTLSELLETRLEGRPNTAISSARLPESSEHRAERYAARLNDLRDRHIFQWATYYQQNLQYIFRDMHACLIENSFWDRDIALTRDAFADHAKDIFERGYAFSLDRSIPPDVARDKSLSGLQRFLFLLMSLLFDEDASIRDSKSAMLACDIVSSFLTGVIEGYGRCILGSVSGWSMLSENPRAFLPALGFSRGEDVIRLLENFSPGMEQSMVYKTIVPALIAIERVAAKVSPAAYVVPRLSRVTVGSPSRLDITITVSASGIVRDFLIACFFEDQVDDHRLLDDAIAYRASVVIASLAAQTPEALDARRVLDASDIAPRSDQAHEFSEVVASRLYEQVVADQAESREAGLERNYASEFPLEDPDFRQFFMVDRYSVRALLEKIQRGTGIHLWCSVRRSGKTTAAMTLSNTAGGANLVFQTMDHQPTQVEHNVIENGIRAALTSAEPISSSFFQDLVDESLLATLPAGYVRQKTILIIDEYESLFGLIAELVEMRPGLKYTVAQPLLSQMVDFARRNLLILMGQRPDAHFILSAQNQFSPVVKQHNFPLFEHTSDSTTSEFAQFLRRVLSDKLPFGGGFANAVYDETRGHPYLTVNLMVDFCDWLIESNEPIGEPGLRHDRFAVFVRERLSQPSLKRSPHYAFFQNMLAEYLSYQGERSEPWLFAVATVLQEIGQKRSVTIPSIRRAAQRNWTNVNISAEALLTAADMSNFIRLQTGHVFAGIPLMGRLAAATSARIN